MDIKGKKLLVLGGTYASLDVVKNARRLGVQTIVTDNLQSGVAKDAADETASVSTVDFAGLKQLIKERGIDGVFCGPSEFNIRNMIKFCEENSLRCYTTTEVWDHCANKDVFKDYCIKYGVDCPREYRVDENSAEAELSSVDYPVIVKPVDGSSSRGISVCRSAGTLREACKTARAASVSGRIIVEKYIENGGALFGARYIIKDGEAYPYLLMDTYVADAEGGKLISHCSYVPSKHSAYYMEKMDANVRAMLKGMGVKNGTAFFQALPCDGKIYFHEMGYRLSGGMLFKFTEPLMGINDMQMMIRFALGGEMMTEDEQKRLDVTCGGRFGAQLMIPLSVGKIAAIEGLEELKAMPCVHDFIQYYFVGDTIDESCIGTLGQHFGRFTMIANSEKELEEAILRINRALTVRSEAGEVMNTMKFDVSRRV